MKKLMPIISMFPIIWGQASAFATTNAPATSPTNSPSKPPVHSASFQVSGSSEDQFMLGRAYARGEGVTQSYELAGCWYRKAADQGNLKAMHNLGILYLEGKGTPKDEVEGYKLIRQAAEQGDPKSAETLGILLSKGIGVRADPLAAKGWLEKGVKAGSPEAMLFLGRQQLKAENPALRKNGVDLILRAGDLGDGPACLEAGRLLESGSSELHADKARAAEYFKQGALAGDPWCSYQYASIIMGRNALEAYPWAKIAAEAHIPPAVGLYQECLGYLTPEERLKGDSLAKSITSAKK
jgi:TPR repeat protein